MSCSDAGYGASGAMRKSIDSTMVPAVGAVVVVPGTAMDLHKCRKWTFPSRLVKPCQSLLTTKALVDDVSSHEVIGELAGLRILSLRCWQRQNRSPSISAPTLTKCAQFIIRGYSISRALRVTQHTGAALPPRGATACTKRASARFHRARRLSLMAGLFWDLGEAGILPTS
jgi:hypothetical protein